MKITWEVGDFRASLGGARTRSLRLGGRVWAQASDEVWILGFVATSDTPHPRALISMRDGMVLQFSTDESLIEHLNKAQLLPIEVFPDA